ncbi:hypothetical protein NNJEOMEG_02543 [Fundidesulfovibrio magnetotacticus]|uniref:Uncharacterized protein n=1 Tax=Fundidesulfovibrio magnetotacticus TaxID=2730080 RepID=A0A6V8LY03_9BACT|nr:hypothetical protein [Fundidesulfovibrio magnetotacticus]GFK94696.1 hypothetical protein NNJEOMEG_02543 [Fundidesulfovibrio magnetotacticus]
MELLAVIVIAYVMLYLVEVYLGGTLPCPTEGARLCQRLPKREFFGRVLPLAAAGLGIPLSFAHPWAILLVVGAAVLFLAYGRGKDAAR